MADELERETEAASAVDADALDYLERINAQLAELVRFEQQRETAQLWAEFRDADRRRNSAVPGVLLLLVLLAVVLLTSEPKGERL